AARQRVRVLLGDAAVRGPARVAEAGGRDRAVPPGRLLQEGEVADGADVVEAPVLAERDPGGVVAGVLEAFQPVEEEWRAGPRSRSPSSALPRSTSRRSSSLGFRPRAGKFSFTCGYLGITEAASASDRPSSARQSRSADASPSPVTWSRR